MEEDNYAEVNIYGKSYKIRAQANSEYINNVAEYVNGKMEEVENSIEKKQSEIRIAILAALNITDELFRARDNKQDEINKIRNKSEELIDRIDKKIENS